MALSLLAMGVQCAAATLEEQARMRTWQYEREVAAPTFRALGLRGRTLREAWDTLVNRGLECGIRAAGDLWGVKDSGLRFSAALVCSERTDRPSDTCERLAVTYSIQEPADSVKQNELYRRWDELHVREAQVNCQFDYRLARRNEDQSNVPWAQSRARLMTDVGRGEAADKAVGQLLAQGFECGMTATGRSDVSLHCTRRPSTAAGCDAERLRITLNGSKYADRALWSSRLKALKVRQVDATCVTLSNAVST